jgi:hypothetical protein
MPAGRNRGAGGVERNASRRGNLGRRRARDQIHRSLPERRRRATFASLCRRRAACARYIGWIVRNGLRDDGTAAIDRFVRADHQFRSVVVVLADAFEQL